MTATLDLPLRIYATRLYATQPRKHLLFTGWPLFERVSSQEIEGKFRRGKGISFRIPLTRRAFMVGRWRDEVREEFDALTEAVQGRPVDLQLLEDRPQDVVPDEAQEESHTIVTTTDGVVTTHRVVEQLGLVLVG